MRVAINALLEGGRAGGVQQGIVDLAIALAKSAEPEDDIVFATLAGHDDWLSRSLRPPGRRTHAVHRGTRRELAARLRATKIGGQAFQLGVWTHNAVGRAEQSTGLMEEIGADVVHYPYQRAELTTIPFVFQPWDLQFMHYPELTTGAARRYRVRTYRVYCQRAAVVVAPSLFVKDDLISKLGIEADKIAVIAPYGLKDRPGSRGPGDPTSLRERIGCAEEDLVALYPAQAWPHKNHERLIEAVGICRNAGLRIHLACTGSPTAREDELMKLAERSGVADSVHFLGFVTDEDLDLLYETAFCMVFPSLFEGWGYPVIEAYSRGVPVAASQTPSLDPAVGGAAERFDPESAGEMAQALTNLATSETRRQELISKGHRRAGLLSHQHMGRSFRAVYRSAFERTSLPTDLLSGLSTPELLKTGDSQ